MFGELFFPLQTSYFPNIRIPVVQVEAGGPSEGRGGDSAALARGGHVSLWLTDSIDWAAGHTLRVYDTSFGLAATVRVLSVARQPGYVPPHNQAPQPMPFGYA